MSIETGLDAGLENRQRGLLESEVVLELLLYRRTDRYLIVRRDIRHTFQK